MGTSDKNSVNSRTPKTSFSPQKKDAATKFPRSLMQITTDTTTPKLKKILQQNFIITPTTFDKVITKEIEKYERTEDLRKIIKERDHDSLRNEECTRYPLRSRTSETPLKNQILIDNKYQELLSSDKNIKRRKEEVDYFFELEFLKNTSKLGKQNSEGSNTEKLVGINLVSCEAVEAVNQQLEYLDNTNGTLRPIPVNLECCQNAENTNAQPEYSTTPIKVTSIGTKNDEICKDDSSQKVEKKKRVCEKDSNF
ncbi:hypothetical protein Zmor_004288 [Zophobas morio]|uniref:Uncharacterized protein n=1 Tax=Zophobas morio TaxID=2755281 RepID=A0AA38HIG0_9CUCU|nr:hypothetical protein Zmor_004288 [Zophobas morio]